MADNALSNSTGTADETNEKRERPVCEAGEFPSAKVQKVDASSFQQHSELLEQNKIVMVHYDDRPDQGIKKRNESAIFHLRNFNNWTKSILIKKYIGNARYDNIFRPRYDRDFYVLDLCCGKMGDALKWRNGKVNCVVGADIALEGLKHGMERYYERKMNKNFSLSLICADCTLVDITRGLPDPKMLFDIASCQFALHYSFGTREHARTMIRNAAQNLRKGGFFIGTIPNADILLERAKETGRWTSADDICSIEFEDDINEIKIPFEFGVKYTFTLKDAIDSCPEYLINVKLLQSLCEEFDLELRELKPFKQFKDEHFVRNRDLWGRMKVPGLTKADYEVIDLYQVFAFEKMRGGSSNIRRVPPTREQISELDDVIDQQSCE